MCIFNKLLIPVAVKMAYPALGELNTFINTKLIPLRQYNWLVHRRSRSHYIQITLSPISISTFIIIELEQKAYFFDCLDTVCQGELLLGHAENQVADLCLRHQVLLRYSQEAPEFKQLIDVVLVFIDHCFFDFAEGAIDRMLEPCLPKDVIIFTCCFQ